MSQITITRYHPQIEPSEIIAFITQIQKTEFAINLTEEDLYPLKNIPNYFKNNNNKQINFWIALSEQKIIGCIGLKQLNDHESEVKRFFVDKNFRGLGISDGLISATIEQAVSSQQTAIYLGTGSQKVRAIAFYQKKHFIEIDKINLPKEYLIDPLDDRFFKLTLEDIKNEKSRPFS